MGDPESVTEPQKGLLRRGQEGEPRHFALFGGVIRSSIGLPELRPVDSGSWDWGFHLVDGMEAAQDPRLLGTTRLYAEVFSRVYAHAAGFRVEVDDTGVFDLSTDGRSIRHRPRPDPWWDFSRAHLLGQVLAIALQLQHTLTLHASAVETGDGVVAFLAPKHFGKTSLALTLTAHGARFVTDDMLPLRSDQLPMALPGVPSLRVRADQEGAKVLVQQAFGNAIQLSAPGRDLKIRTPPLPPERTLTKPRRLAALYLLGPVREGQGGNPLERIRLHGPEATTSVLGQTKIGGILGRDFAPQLLRQVAGIVGKTPTYRLRIIRDLSLLPQVAETLLAWHGRP